jgi:hypothetical protein
MVPTETQKVRSFEVLFQRLHESHDLSVYEAIERLVKTAETVGLDSDALARMLDDGRTFEELLEAVEFKMEMNVENRRTA